MSENQNQNVSEKELNELITGAREAMKTAYCPYSNFPVGAALLCEDGTTYLGCNVENAAYTVGLCAERTAAVKAVSEGKRKFRAIAVTTKLSTVFATPCGACRQFLVEFGLDLDVYLVKPDLSYKKVSLNDLLPMAFTPDSLAST
ncbi:Cytidine deaminase [Halotydeus destructor]|nr:Cytidine deaminase [Halotydeus destructor]